MIQNYLLTSFRHLASQKGYGLINIFGLAIGMAAVIIIGFYARAQFYINSWHEKGDRICRVLIEVHTPGADRFVSFRTDGPLAAALEADYPEVEKGLRIERTWTWVQVGDRGFQEQVLIADPEFFDVFDFKGVDCDPKTALQEPYSILITEETVLKFFPEGDPIGKTITIDGVEIKGDYTVTGILKETVHSSIWFRFVISTMTPGGISEWANRWNPGAQHRSFRTWLLLKEGVSTRDLEPKIQSALERYLGPDDAKKHSYHLEPLERVHLYWGRDYDQSGTGEIDRVITYIIVACFILAIACVNYINLMTARASRRAREIGIRKVIGANRRQLITQFMGESVLTACASLILGIVIALLVFPHFASMIDWGALEMTFDADVIGALTVLAVLVGLFSGTYPALFLTRVDPAVVVKGEDTFTGTKSWARRTLVVVQFTASIVIILGTLSVRDQIHYVIDRDLGYRWKDVIQTPILWISRTLDLSKERALSWRYDTVMQAFLEHPNILDAAATRFPQGAHTNQGLHAVEGSSEDWNFGIQDTDENFFAFNGIEILAGRVYRNRSETLESGETILVGRRYEEYILNAKAVELGWKTDEPNPYAEAIGKQIGAKGQPFGTLVGVCADYHARSLHSPIGPIAFNLNPGGLKYIQLQLGPGDRAETVAHLKKVWQDFIPSRPFMHNFLERTVEEWNYWNERRLSNILEVAAILAIFVSCLGLLGLVSYLAETKMKEIGIRKVLGAGTASIIRHLTSDFARLILIANLIAWPIAWWAIDDWLNNFAYRMEMGVSPFLLTGLLAFVAAGTMIGYHTYRAASREPVDTIRR